MNNSSLGGKVFFLKGYPGEIFSADLSTKEVTLLTSCGGSHCGNFDISKDGKRIFFGSKQSGKWEIYSASIGIRGLENEVVLLTNNSVYSRGAEDPRLSWDDSKIAYHRDGNIHVCDLWSMNDRRCTSSGRDWAPAFSPDGTVIAFGRGTDKDEVKGDIYLLPVDGSPGQEQKKTKNAGSDWFPSFSEGGNLLYVSNRSFFFDDDIYIIHKSKLTKPQPDDFSISLLPLWQRLGSQADPWPVYGREDHFVYVSSGLWGKYEVQLFSPSSGYSITLVSHESSNLLGPIMISGRSRCSGKFCATNTKYNEREDLTAACVAEFGPGFTVADWNEVKTVSDVSMWLSDIGCQKWDSDSLMVSWEGKRFWKGTRRHYFLTRHDHHLPTSYTFLTHDNIDDHLVDLGSWFDLKMAVLCHRE